jgi:hypothetical protein
VLCLSRRCSDANKFAVIQVMVCEFSIAMIRYCCVRHDCNDEPRKAMTSLDGLQVVGNYGESFAKCFEGTVLSLIIHQLCRLPNTVNLNILCNI